MSNEIINKHAVYECKKLIAETLSKASDSSNFIYGIDTNKLSEIYNNINSSNAQDLFVQAKILVDTQIHHSRHRFDMGMWKISGAIVIGGTIVAGTGYCLEYFFKKDLFQPITNLGIGVIFVGVIMAFSVGH